MPVPDALLLVAVATIVATLAIVVLGLVIELRRARRDDV